MTESTREVHDDILMNNEPRRRRLKRPPRRKINSPSRNQTQDKWVCEICDNTEELCCCDDYVDDEYLSWVCEICHNPGEQCYCDDYVIIRLPCGTCGKAKEPCFCAVEEPPIEESPVEAPPEENGGDNNFDDPLPELKCRLDMVYNFICKYTNTQGDRYTQLQITNSHLETENKKLQNKMKKSKQRIKELEDRLKESEEINRVLVEESENRIKELEDRLKESEEQLREERNKLENPANLSQEELLKYINILGKEWEKRIIEVEKNKKCVVCFDANKSMLCLPCGHLCLCNPCSKKVDNICPLDRKRVVEFKHVYF